MRLSYFLAWGVPMVLFHGAAMLYRHVSTVAQTSDCREDVFLNVLS